MDFSVIIPTRNEEEYLPELLGSIVKQTSPPKEIIVADSRSQDNTTKIAKDFGCKVVPGGLPAVGRNQGAKYATTSLLIFMDADAMIADPFFFKKVLEYFSNNNLDFGLCLIKNKPGNKILGKIAIIASNIRRYLDLLAYKTFGTFFGGSAHFVIIKKDVFNKIGGFDETLVHYEDTDFLKRTVKEGYKYGLVPYLIYLSGRRYNNMPLSQFIKTGIYMFLYKITTLLGYRKSEIYMDRYGQAKGGSRK